MATKENRRLRRAAYPSSATESRRPGSINVDSPAAYATSTPIRHQPGGTTSVATAASLAINGTGVSQRGSLWAV